MTSCSMSSDTPFRCPICRASQPLRDVCRRCQADLRLVVRAHCRLAYVKRLQAEAQTLGDSEREQCLAQEVRWLTSFR